MRKILIIRFSSIGDIILTTPLVAALRRAFPDAQIDYLTKKQFAPLLTNNPHLSQVIAFDKTAGNKPLFGIIKQLKHQKYELICDLHNNLRSKQVRWRLHAQWKTTFSKDYVRRWLFIATRINWYDKEVPVRLRYFKGLEKLGVLPGRALTELYPTQADAQCITQQLTTLGIDVTQPIVVLAPGASYANKQWPTTHFAQLAGMWLAQNTQVVLAGGPTDTALCQQITQQAPGAATLAGELSLMQSAALLQRAQLVYANDSGLMHMAQAVKTPVVAFFGPTTWHLGYMPIPQQAKVMQVEKLWCRPCTHNGRHKCPLGHHKCLKNISAQAAYHAGLQLTHL